MMHSTVTLTIGLLFALALGYCYLMRPVLMTIFAVGSPLVLLTNADQLNLQPFTWIKIFTLSVAMLIVFAYTRSSGRMQKYLGVAAYAILLLNVFEAVILDATKGHYLNAVAGATLMITQPGSSSISKASAGRMSLRYDLPLLWILSYTAWNLAVVCANYPPRLFDHLAVLLAPLAATLFLRDRQRWLEARCFILSVYSVGIVLVIDLLHLPWIKPAENPDAFYPFLSAIAAALAAVNLLAAYRRRYGSANAASSL